MASAIHEATWPVVREIRRVPAPRKIAC